MTSEELAFKISPSSGDMTAAATRALWFSKPFLVYFSLAVLFALVGLVGGSRAATESDDFWTAWGLISLVLLALPFVYTFSRISRSWSQRQGANETEYTFTHDAFTARRDGIESKFEWNAFSRIHETSRFIYLFLRDGPKLVLHKQLMVGTDVETVKRYLQGQDVPDKRWMRHVGS